MNFKIQNLYTKVYSSFIKGEYGKPIIPNKNQVMQKINELTTEEYLPLTSKTKMEDIDIKSIRKSFSNIIDDIDILFKSIESESKEVLDQLTNSLQEHNGVKREFRDLELSTLDISNGKLGDEFLNYNFSDSFRSSTYINTQKSDPINFGAGVFTIGKNDSNLLSLEHYRGSKLDFIVVENSSQILEQGYVGSADAASILDTDDPRQLQYKIRTTNPTKLRTQVVLQLSPNGNLIDINALDIDVDSDIAKGFIRLYYKDQFQWKDVATKSIQEIKGDHVVFEFPNTKTTHVKLEFIKDSPDSFDTNTYYFFINNIEISLSSTKRYATLFSKAIEMEGYGNEIPIIFNLSASTDSDIPKNCNIEVYVTQDVVISGAFLTSGNIATNFDSPDVYKFDNTYSGNVFLSELLNSSDTISGILPYKNADFKWYNLQHIKDNRDNIQERVEFDNTLKHDPLINSIYSSQFILFGDLNFTDLLTFSGWVNTSNQKWAQLKPYVDAGFLVSGVTIGGASWNIGGANWFSVQQPDGNLHPSISGSPLYSGQWIGYGSGVGFPFNYSGGLFTDVIAFGDYSSAINGWWRPFSEYVTDSGIFGEIAISGHLKPGYNINTPDFYFNNTSFYKIYKISKFDNLINSTLKLYSYQERPTHSDSDYFTNLYPCNFNWHYKTDKITKLGSKERVFDTRLSTTWSGYIISVSGYLGINEEWVFDPISEIRIHDTNIVLQDREYNLIYDTTLSGIDFSPLGLSQPALNPSNTTFDIKFSYQVNNDYLSTFTAYAIVSPNSSNPIIEIPNPNINNTDKLVIGGFSIKDLDTDEILKDTKESDIKFEFPIKETEGYYKITLFCASNPDNGFAADNWVPYISKQSSNIFIGGGIKIVNKLTPINMVGFDTLLYDSAAGLERAAIIKEGKERYIVVKSPNKDTLPGYYFDSINRRYEYNVEKFIDNKDNWIRQNTSGFYTTGSSGLLVYSKDMNTSGLDWSSASPNLRWNNGAVVNEFPNYTENKIFDFHSTYGYPINLNKDKTQVLRLYMGDIDPTAPLSSGVVGYPEWTEWVDPEDNRNLADYGYIDRTVENLGYLFYNTAENLPSYYSIYYRTATGTDDTNNRFLYKITLSSNEKGSLVPKIRSIRFMANEV